MKVIKNETVISYTKSFVEFTLEDGDFLYMISGKHLDRYASSTSWSSKAGVPAGQAIEFTDGPNRLRRLKESSVKQYDLDHMKTWYSIGGWATTRYLPGNTTVLVKGKRKTLDEFYAWLERKASK